MNLMRMALTRAESLARWVFGRIVLAASGADVKSSVYVARHARLRATDGGTIRLSDCVVIDSWAHLQAQHGLLEVGARSYIGQGVVVCAREAVLIGADCLIAENVTIRDQDHRFGVGLITARAGFLTSAVTIGSNVWIGAKATITRGVTIGDNSVIGANSVVTSDIPANSVAVGAPARIIREIS